MRSVFSDEKKLTIAALSHTLPDRLIEQTTPLSAISQSNPFGAKFKVHRADASDVAARSIETGYKTGL